jgi:hypothetical protein
MDSSPEQARAREKLRSVIGSHCRIGVVVTPHYPTQLLGHEALCGLNKILSTNSFRSTSHDVFFDQGIFACASAGERAADALCAVEAEGAGYPLKPASTRLPRTQLDIHADGFSATSSACFCSSVR